jgi:hypothetical protein
MCKGASLEKNGGTDNVRPGIRVNPEKVVCIELDVLYPKN